MTDDTILAAIAEHIEERGPAFAALLEREYDASPKVTSLAEFIHYMRESWRMAHYAPELSNDESDAMAWGIFLRCLDYELQVAAAHPSEPPLSETYYVEIMSTQH